MQSVLNVVGIIFVSAMIPLTVTPTQLLADDAVERDERPASPLPLPSPLWLPKVFGNHMVLQRDRPLPIWGRSAPGDVLVVSLAKTVVETKADAQGHWRLTLPPQPSGGPRQLTIRGAEHQRTIEDVMVGEVWMCSGQSNMELSTKEALHPREEISAAKYPKIRFFNVANAIAKEPQADCEGRWCVCSPDTVGDFSAVAYYFGRELHEHLDQPIGLIDASWGGSLCEAWMSREALTSDPDFEQVLHRALGDNIGKGCGMYNAMIHPLIPFAIRGATWYQGESNASRAWQYQKLFPALIRDWRTQWGQGDFPFYYVQLAPLDRHDDEWVELWEAQLKTLAVPNTGMAVITDLDEPGLHPVNKQGSVGDYPCGRWRKTTGIPRLSTVGHFTTRCKSTDTLFIFISTTPPASRRGIASRLVISRSPATIASFIPRLPRSWRRPSSSKATTCHSRWPYDLAGQTPHSQT